MTQNSVASSGDNVCFFWDEAKGHGKLHPLEGAWSLPSDAPVGTED